MGKNPWRRHRALTLMLDAWPELERDVPPPRDVLARVLDRSGSAWTLADPAASSEHGGYEAAVIAGRIPTREGSWHDTFNALAFVTFPRTKAALHRRCLDLQLARARTPPRSREEDALTLIDETSLVIAGPVAAIAEFERARPTRALEVLDRLVRCGGLSVHVFGHALLEHVVLERPPIGAGVLTVAFDSSETRARVERTQIDATLAERVAAGGFPRPCLSPTLPWPDPVVESWLDPIPPA